MHGRLIKSADDDELLVSTITVLDERSLERRDPVSRSLFFFFWLYSVLQREGLHQHSALSTQFRGREQGPRSRLYPSATITGQCPSRRRSFTRERRRLLLATRRSIARRGENLLRSASGREKRKKACPQRIDECLTVSARVARRQPYANQHAITHSLHGLACFHGEESEGRGMTGKYRMPLITFPCCLRL